MKPSQNCSDKLSAHPAIAQRLLSAQNAIETWLRQQWQLTPAPFYCSVDLRNQGFKIAPVDTNLFPGGFNNLNANMQPACIKAAQQLLNQRYPSARRLLIIPENHTRNQFYWQNVKVLWEILSHAGLEVRIGTLSPLLQEIPNTKIAMHLIERKQNQLCINEFIPDLILLNNDLSEGVPEILQHITQPILPSLHLGWSERLKSDHFQHYQNIAEEFAQLVHIDPWLINPYFAFNTDIDFKQHQGEQAVIDNVDQILEKIKVKYQEYRIDKKPFVIVKSNAGTYGMGIMTAFSGEDIKTMNRSDRNKMSRIKGGSALTSVLIQEGVYTTETLGENHASAEPVIYLLGAEVIGGFYRAHQQRGPDENLNAPGMQFEAMPFASPCNAPDPKLPPSECPNRFYIYSIIARLAALAAARELNSQSQQIGTT